MVVSPVPKPEVLTERWGVAADRGDDRIVRLGRDQALGHDPAEASLDIAQFAVVDLALLSDAVGDPPVVLETDHEASMVVSQDVVTGRASRARWAVCVGWQQRRPQRGTQSG